MLFSYTNKCIDPLQGLLFLQCTPHKASLFTKEEPVVIIRPLKLLRPVLHDGNKYLNNVSGTFIDQNQARVQKNQDDIYGLRFPQRFSP